MTRQPMTASVFVARGAVGVGVAVLLCALAGPALALTGSDKATVTKGLMESCIAAMKSDEGAQGLPDAKINGYCSCTASKTASELRKGEVQRYFYSGGTATVRMQDMNARISRDCAARYLR